MLKIICLVRPTNGISRHALGGIQNFLGMEYIQP